MVERIIRNIYVKYLKYSRYLTNVVIIIIIDWNNPGNSGCVRTPPIVFFYLCIIIQGPSQVPPVPTPSIYHEPVLIFFFLHNILLLYIL